MKKQKGITITGMLMAAAVLIVLLLLAFKVIPAYTEFNGIENAFKAMAMDPKLRNGNRQAVMGAYAARMTVDRLEALRPEDIEVTKEGDGIVLTAEYEKKVPLFKNVSLLFHFKPSSR